MNSDEKHTTNGRQQEHEDEFFSLLRQMSHRDPGDGPPREMTPNEVREALLCHLWEIIDYWDQFEDREGARTVRDRISGAVFSVLSTLDGSSIGLPGFIIMPDPCEEDRDYLTQHGINWFPNATADGRTDIGPLHEEFHKFDPRKTTENSPEGTFAGEIPPLPLDEWQEICGRHGGDPRPPRPTEKKESPAENR